MSRLVMHQTFRYDYPGPIGKLRHHLMVLPPVSHGDQQRVSAVLDVRGAKVEVDEWTDQFGNVAVDIRAARVHKAVEFVVDVVVERGQLPVPAAVPPGAHQYLDPSSLTQPDRALASTAQRLLGTDGPGVALAERINAWVASEMRYRHDVTSVRTTAAEAIFLGEGVCQDYAHVMIALCRLCGLPARYVSGHLLGEGASHAWVEVLVPPAEDPGALVAVAFDPTNNRAAGRAYLTVAVGRDYSDVAPTSGTYSGPPGGRLTTAKSLHEQATDLVPA